MIGRLVGWLVREAHGTVRLMYHDDRTGRVDATLGSSI